MRKVLLIEDSVDVRETTQEILELADYEVLVAENGKIGVELAKKELPQVIICDIMMPEMDGYTVLKILGRNPQTSTIPFIFLTAKAEKSDFRKGMTLGADDYLTKPFDETDLLDAVEARIDKREKLVAHAPKEGGDKLTDFVETHGEINELLGLSSHKKRLFDAKENLFRSGDAAHYLYFISSGKVKCASSDDYGKELVNDVLVTGDFLGYLNILEHKPYHLTATAMEPTEVVMIHKQDFTGLIEKNRVVAAAFIKLLADNVVDKEKRLLQLAYASVRERVAQALLKLIEGERQKRTYVGVLYVSREDLANMVGTAKESLIRSVSEFKRDGILQTSGREIEILKEEDLKSIAHGIFA